MAFYNLVLLGLFLICQHIRYVMAASECTTAIVASVFGTIGGLLFIAAIVALVWYCCRQRNSTSLSTSSADSASDHEFSFGTKTKGGNIGLNGNGTPVTFSHRYSEKAPSVAYNTSGVVNPAFADGSREVLIDMPQGHHDEVKIDLDGDPSFKPPAHNDEIKIDMDGGSGIKLPSGSGDAKIDMDGGSDIKLPSGSGGATIDMDGGSGVKLPFSGGDVKIDMDGGSEIKLPSGSGDAKLDMDWDHERNVDFPDGNRPEFKLPTGNGIPSGSGLPGTDANVIIKGPSKPKIKESIPSVDLPQKTVDVFLERPGNGGFGLLIARDKTLPPPALFIREVTPGGIAAKTGLVDKGDKIIAINETSIEGMPHDQAMSLLRDDSLKILHLTLKKKELYKIKGRSVDIPDGIIEESCKVDMSPELEAGVPTLDVEGVQGRAPDGEALLDVNMGKPHLNKPEGTLKTQVSAPDTFTDVDLGKPSYGLDLPSSKRKSAKCFSCASSGDRDEPYIKGKSNVGIGLNTPDMTADRKAQDVKLSTDKPDLKLPSRDFDGPDGHMEMKAGRNFDMSGSGPEIRDPDVGDTQNEHGLRGSAPDVDIDVDHGRYNGDASLPTAGVAPKGPGLGPSSAEMNLPSGKKKLGNCLTCTASGKKDEPYRKARKNYGYEFEGQDVDGSIEMKRLSGPSTDASGPDVNISKKRPGAKLDTDDVDSPEARLSTEISGPNAKLSPGRVKGHSARGDVHSPEVDFPSTKKKSGSCFSCVGSGDKGEPYRTNREKADFGWNPPEVDGSLKMEKPDELDISGSGPGFSGRGEKKDLGYQVTGPDFNVHGPNKGISTEIPKMAVDTAYPHVKSADVPSGNMSAGISGPEIDLSGPSADVPDRDFTIKGPKGDFSGPEFDASRPKAGVSGPEIDLSGPGPDLPKGDINIKGLKGDFSGPKFDVNRPRGGVSRPEMDLSGPSADVSKGDFNVRGPKGDFPGPEFDARRPEIGVNRPEIDLDGPNSDVSNGEFNMRGPKGDSFRPETEFSGPNIDLRGPKAGASSVSGPGPDLSTGNIKDPKVHLDATSAEIDLPSRKKRMGGNCFSCAGGADKDVPYGKKAVDANVDLKGSDAGVSGPNLDTSPPTVGVSGPGIDYSGPSADLPKGDFNIKGPKGDFSGPEFDAIRPKAGFSGSEIDVSGPRADVPDRDFNIKGPKGDFSGPEFDAIRPKAGFSGPEIDPSGPTADIPDRDFHIKGPKGDFSGPEFEASRFKAGVSRPEIDLSGPSADVSKRDFNIRGPKGDFSGPEFDACRPEIGVNGPEIDLSGPNSGVSNGEINIKGPKGEFSRSELDSLRPETEFSGPNIDFRGPKAGASVKEPNMELTGKPKVSGPGLDLSAGDIKDPTVNLDAPSAELDLPSRKKRMGGNCFSCAGGADKDLPYGKKGVDANVDLKGTHADFSGPELNTSRPEVGGSGPGIDLSGPSADILKGDVNITGPKGDFSGPEFDASRPKTGVSEPEIDVSGLSAGISKADFDVRGPKGDYSGLDVDASRPKPGLPGPHLELSGPSADISKGDFNIGGPKANLSRPEFDTSYPKSGVSGPKVSAGRPSTDFSGPKLDVSGLKADLSVEKPKVSGPDLDASIGKVEDPEVNVNSPSADLDFPSKKKRKSVNCLSCTGGVDKDAPYGKKAMDANIDLEGPNGKNRDGEFELGHPEFDGKFGAKNAGSFDLHGPNIDSEDLAMKINTPDFDLRSNKPNSSFQTPDLDVKAGNKGEIDISLPNVTHEKPKLAGTFTGEEDKDIELRGPGLDVHSSQGSADWGIPGSNLPDGPRVAINKPSISGGDLDTDAEVPGLRISGSKPSSELDTNALDNNTDVPKSDLRFGISKPDLDTKAEQPDLDISARKPQFGGEEFDMDNSEPEIPTNDFNFDPSLPGIGVGVGGLDKNMRTGEYLDTDINRPDINEYDMDIPKPKIETGDVSLEGSLPELHTSAESPAIGLDDRQLDINVWQPTQDILAPKTLDSPEPNGGWSFQPGGKDYDTNFDWSVNTSTPKQKGSNLAKLELETEPLAVVNDSNLELQSTPTKFPSMDYDEPRNLQRYDEIRPDMELRLLSPKKTDYPEPGFEFENSEGSIDIGKDGIERKPGRMSLVKVEENVTICSASLEEDEPTAPRKRTLTLDREVRQKIEVVFPGEEGSDTKQKGSSSSSSSSSSESEDNKEKTEKRKKKSRLFKAFRKSSTSSASSKEDETPKQKEKERKSSTSSSASEDEKEGKKKPSKGDLAMGITTQIKPKKRKSPGSSSSSDNKTGKKRSVKQKDSKQHKTSTSSTSSSDEDHSKKTNFPISSEYPSAPVKYNVEYTTLPEQYLVSANAGGPKKPESSVPTVVSHIRDDKSKHEERKSSTSSSSDESIPKHTTSPKDPQPSMLYKVEYFTNQQKYIIEPRDEFDKPELSAAEVQEDAPKVEFHSVKPEDPKFSFIESKERKSSTSSLSSEKGASDVQEVDLKMESPSIELKDPSLFFTKANERKSSTTSTSSEESGRLSPNLGVSVQRQETVHQVSAPDHFSINQVDVPAVTEDPLVIVTRSFKRPVPESDEEGATKHSKVQLNEPPVTLAYHLQYSHNIRMGMEDNDNQVQEEGIAPVVRSRSVEYEVPDLSIVLQPEDDHSFKANERKSSTTSTSSEESGRLSPNLGVSVQRHETVHHVSTPDHFSINQVDVPAVTEDPLVIVTRSFKRPVPESDEEGATEHSKVQLNEPPVTLAYHLQYSHNIRMGMEDNDNRVQEEGIAPVVRSRSVEYEVPDLSIVLQPEDGHSKDAEKAENRVPTDQKDRASPTMKIQAHTFETVYEVNIPERPTTDNYELEIQEHSPVVVLRSVKRISPEHNDLEEDTQILTSNADVQLSEPSNDVQLDYPEGWGVSTTDDYHLPRAEEEWIVKHSVKKDKPDITSLAGSLDFPENKNQPKAESNQDKDASVKSPREASSARRNSNSRLWDLMQGYLIERPIVDDDDDKDSTPDPEKTTEVKNEGDSKPEKPERSVYNFTIQPVKFDTVDVQVQANDSKEPAKKLTTSFTQVEVDVPKETPPVSQFDIIAVKPDVKEQHTELETAPVPKVESVIPKATSSVSQFEPVAIQLDVGGKQPIVKEPRSSWRRETSLPSGADDNESDPWMRHYSKGLYQRGHHQPSTSKFTEKESTVPERPGLSLSKVPHVKGVRTSSEHQRERPRYSIDGRAHIEPVPFPSVTNRSQTGTSRQEPSNRPSVSSLRSFWDK